MAKPKQFPPTSKLLIVSTDAGGVTDEIQAKLRDSFDDFRVVDFHPRKAWGSEKTSRDWQGGHLHNRLPRRRRSIP
jgi:hypothetical protein